MSPSFRIAIALFSFLRHEILNRGHRFRFRADGSNVDGVRCAVQNLGVPRTQLAAVPVAPVAYVELRLLDAQEPKSPKDSGVTQDSRHAIQSHGHVSFLHLHPDAVPTTVPF